MRLVQLSRHSIAFPSPEGALREPNGLLALGGDLSPARLLMAYLSRFQQIIVMDNGQIIEQGTHAELLARQGRYYQFKQGL